MLLLSLFQPFHDPLHVVMDVGIGLSYVAISGALLAFWLRVRQQLPFNWVFVAFAAFIVSCTERLRLAWRRQRAQSCAPPLRSWQQGSSLPPSNPAPHNPRYSVLLTSHGSRCEPHAADRERVRGARFG